MKEIPLTKGKVALVDDSDYEWLNQWNWHAFWQGTNWYAVRSSKVELVHTVYMHRVILGLPPGGPKCDHRDRNGLNNQRHNLRTSTDTQNNANKSPQSNNTSGFKGVSWHKRTGKWRATIGVNGSHKHIGLFNDRLSAALAYDKEAKALFGDFCATNLK